MLPVREFMHTQKLLLLNGYHLCKRDFEGISLCMIETWCAATTEVRLQWFVVKKYCITLVYELNLNCTSFLWTRTWTWVYIYGDIPTDSAPSPDRETWHYIWLVVYFPLNKLILVYFFFSWFGWNSFKLLRRSPAPLIKILVLMKGLVRWSWSGILVALVGWNLQLQSLNTTKKNCRKIGAYKFFALHIFVNNFDLYHCCEFFQNIPCVYGPVVMELMWGIQNWMPSLVPREKSQLTKDDRLPVSQGLQTVLSRYGCTDVKPETVS